MPDLGERITRDLTTRYVTVLGVLGVVALLSFFALARIVTDAGDSAELVQLTGEQRVLVQKAVFETHRFLVSSGEERQTARKSLASVLDDLEAGHQRIFFSGSRPLSEPAHEVLSAPPWNLDREMKDFVRFGRAILSLPDSVEGHKTNLAGIALKAANPLMSGLDEASSRFRRDAAGQLGGVVTVQGTSLFIALGLLVLSALGVFRPMVLRLKADFAERSEASARLRESEARLWRILEESPVGVSVSRRRDGKVVFANSRFTDIIGMSRDEFLGSAAREHYVDDAQRQVVLAILRRDGRLDDAEVEFRRKNGSPFWSLLTIRPLEFEDEPVNLAWIYDITERKAAEQQILLAAKVLETVTEAVVITDADNRIIFVNPAFTTITEYSKDEVRGKNPSFLRSGRHDPEFYANLWKVLAETGHWEGEIWNRRKSGAFYAEWLSINALRDVSGAITHFVAVFSDITHRKEDEERIWRQANYDALTGLPNRSLFLDRLSQAVRQAKRDKKYFALMFLDLDGFKAVNDTLGHAAGDVLLQQTATRLYQCMRATDTLARLAGDEFVVILEGVHGRDDPAVVAGKILTSLAVPYELDAGTAHVRGSLGIALYPDDASDGPALIRRADAAMYAVKRGGKNSFLFAGDLPPDA
ncbi:diguanylate cyclase/phosphodiesterase (GGDEF & EAL domains) with PAS/PAC sensor(s) [Paramagnetospirillum magnetotacticum MS-1]|uniref:Diguanylate cyclase/phosphodiesterase (GGDEF & EAL domains) with PAS/PAC sensor(S) n=1 Tax=Paramagnetospirillum magnetotacticum MS-1 TaxID=272627 RepID=A0A0C2YG51_PARME|nr:diguanylate cyclase [Paramagnetospirillum magnetotacticum]KIL98719.1 diguanylate cyclase/phosphodiesterase (GGDEF & EAL domains) with PAS/PAC sensor(s) [Paramagnetospirillum magnetotacticum MS-1]